MHTAGHHHPGGQELHSSISKPPWLTAAPPAAHSQALRATGRLARVEPGVCAPHSTPAQHRQRLATPRPGTTARDRRAALRASQRHAVRPQAGRAPGAIVPVPDRCPPKDPGRRGILWPPLYTVKWIREHIPIVFFTERHHSDRSALGLTGSYETWLIDQAEVRTKCANSILVRCL